MGAGPLTAGEARGPADIPVPRRTSPLGVAILSFILPGLGHFRLGLHRRGLLLLVPTLAAVVALVALAGGGLLGVLQALIRPEVLVAILVVDLGLLATRVVAIVDAYRTAERRSAIGIPYRPVSVALVAVLLAGSFLIHGAAAAVDYRAYLASTSVFVEPGNDDEWAIPAFQPTPSPTPYLSDPGIVPPPTLRPVEGTPSGVPDWALDGRLDLLLIGSDAGPGRWGLRTDTMIVLSVDVRTAHAALLGVPRNVVGVPLPAESAGAFPGGRYPGLLNSLYVYAMDHPSQFPGGDAGGFRAVSGAIQELLGRPLDGAVVVSLNGFVRLVNALGGLWIDVPSRLVDDHYPLEDARGHIYVDIKPGCQLLKGRLALAYARSRHRSDDYDRMRRQQAVLIALSHQVDPIALMPRVTELLDIARDGLWMTLRRDDIRSLAALAAKVEPRRIKTFQFSPPTYPEVLTTRAIAQIRDVAGSVFDDWTSAAPSGTPAPSPEACPPG